MDFIRQALRTIFVFSVSLLFLAKLLSLGWLQADPSRAFECPKASEKDRALMTLL